MCLRISLKFNFAFLWFLGKVQKVRFPALAAINANNWLKNKFKTRIQLRFACGIRLGFAGNLDSEKLIGNRPGFRSLL